MNLALVVCLFVYGQIYVSHAFLDSKYLKDFYNIYKGIAVETRDRKGSAVTPENVTFYMYTKENPKEYKSITGLSSKWSHVTSRTADYVFIVHGWLESKNVDWYKDLKKAYLKRSENFVVIQVDWSGAANEVYGISSASTKDVGNIVGDVIVKLNEENRIPLERIQIVGHSLGGQVAGFAGKRVFSKTGKYLPRITALDPAGPLFATRDENEKLNKHDAEVVFVIHTNGGTFGYQDPCGTIDLFVNGGSSQPGCSKIDLEDLTSIANPIPCDHQRSWAYFIEAVKHPHRFLAKRCHRQKKLLIFEDMQCLDDDTVNMGDLITDKTGNYYVKTNSEKPYGTRPKESGLEKLLKTWHFVKKMWCPIVGGVISTTLHSIESNTPIVFVTQVQAMKI